MKRFGTTGLWRGVVNGSVQVVNVVGTYGPVPYPIVRVERGNDKGNSYAIVWDTGEVIRPISYR